MNRWETRAYAEISAARVQKSLALRDSLPDYLKQLVDALSNTIDRNAIRVRLDREDSLSIGRQHGVDRAGAANYTLDQMIFEYHILRQVIFNIIEEDGFVLSPLETEIIVCSIEQAVNDSATQFSKTLQETRERFTHTLAHDLRGPITASKAATQLLLRQPNNADLCTKTAGRVLRSMDRIDSMISDLLDANRISAGEALPLQITQVDLDALAHQTADELNSAHDNRIVVRSSGKCLGYWDENGLRRVLENLLTNAVKYGSPETPITISIEQTPSVAKLTVHNHGKAIPAEEVPLLFQQYRRARSTKQKTGWGLGLTVVKGITEALGGSVSVSSAEGTGTSFILELPKDNRQAAHK